MTKQIMACTAFCIATAASFSSEAQQVSENTLGSLWPKVAESYPGVGAKDAAIDAARLNEREVKDGKLPQLKAQAQNTYGTFEGSVGAFFPQPGFFNVSGAGSGLDGSSVAANSFGSATFEWELYSFGKLRRKSEAAQAWTGKTISERDAYILWLKKLLSERYISLLYYDAKLASTANNANRLDDIRKITSGLAAAGLRPAADSLLASSSYIQAMGELDKWEGNKNASFIQLRELYGADTINYAASSRRFGHPPQLPSGAGNTIHPSHPALEVLQRQSEYYIISGDAERRAALPSLRLLGGYAFRGTGIGYDGTASNAWQNGFGHSTNNFLAGIGITWHITDLHTKRLKSQKLYKEAEAARWLYAQNEQAMKATLAAAHAKITEQYKQLSKTELAVSQAQSAYTMYLARYRSGLIALSELLQIRILLEQAEDRHIEAALAYWSLLANEAELRADFHYLFHYL